MKALMILLLMLWLHVFADFHLQGILASMKQKDWWNAQSTDPLYRNDYKISLVVHAFDWAFIVLLPIFVSLWGDMNDITPRLIARGIVYILLLVGNACIHYGIDDIKANAKSINLLDDQFAHMIQIVLTWLIGLFIAGW